MTALTAETYPLMPLRDIVLFPGMVAPLVVGRKKSIAALEAAMATISPTHIAVSLFFLQRHTCATIPPAPYPGAGA